MNIVGSGCRVLAVGALILSTTALADLKKAEVVSQTKNWKVLRTKDNMTDKVGCVAIYRDNYRIQLSPGALYISYQGKGGVQGY